MSIQSLWKYEQTLSKRAFTKTVELFFSSLKRLFLTVLLFLMGAGLGIWFVGWQAAIEKMYIALLFSILPTTICALICFGFYRITVPVEMLNEMKSGCDEANAERRRLEEQIKPKLLLEYDEKDPNSYLDTLNRWKPLEDLFNSDIPLNSDDYRYSRLKIRNISKAVSVQSVQVQLTSIEPMPAELKGKLPLPLRFTHDNSTPHIQFYEIQPDSWKFVDVIKQVWSDNSARPSSYVVEHSVAGVDASFDVGEYKIRIDATGSNVTCEPAWFNAGFKDRDGTGTKLWLWEAKPG
jgi:hypothetical protein